MSTKECSRWLKVMKHENSWTDMSKHASEVAERELFPLMKPELGIEMHDKIKQSILKQPNQLSRVVAKEKDKSIFLADLWEKMLEIDGLPYKNIVMRFKFVRLNPEEKVKCQKTNPESN